MSEEQLLKLYMEELRVDYNDVKNKLVDLKNACFNYKNYIKDIEDTTQMLYGELTLKQCNYLNARLRAYSIYLNIINKEEKDNFMYAKICQLCGENRYELLNKDEVINEFYKLKKYFNEKLQVKEKVDTISEFCVRLRKILRLYDENRLFDDFESLCHLIMFMEKNNEIKVISYKEKEKVCKYLADTYDKIQDELELEKLKKEQERKKREEQERIKKIEELQKLIEQEDIEEKKNNEKNKIYNIFTSEEQEFISTISDLIYNSNSNFKYINNYHESIIKYEYDELLELDIQITLEEYNKFKTDILLRNMYTILNELKIIKEESKKYSDNSEEYNLLFNEKETYLNKLNDLYIIFENSELTSDDKNKIETSKMNLIYLINSNNNEFNLENTKIYNNINKAPEEYYLSYLNLIEKLEIGYIPTSPLKGGKYTSNSKKNMLHKLKNFKTRIIYMPLIDNNVLVLMSLYKKSTNDSYDCNLIDLIYLQNKNIIDNLKEDLKDEDKKNKIIEENRRITENLKCYLINNSRGKKLIKE